MGILIGRLYLTSRIPGRYHHMILYFYQEIKAFVYWRDLLLKFYLLSSTDVEIPKQLSIDRSSQAAADPTMI